MKFYKATYFREIFNTDWQSEIGGQGSKVKIRIRPTVIVGDYVVNGKITYQDLTDELIELTLDQAKFWAFKVDDVDKAQQDIMIASETQYDAEKQMKIAVETKVFSTIYSDATNSIATTALDKTNVLDWIVDAEVLLDQQNVPTENRWLILPPKVCGLLNKSDLKAAMLMGDGKSILRRKTDFLGNLSPIANFDIYKSNCLTVTSGTTYQCIAGAKEAVTFAGQVDKTETLRLQDTFGDAVRGLFVYGYKTNKPDGLVSMPVTVA